MIKHGARPCPQQAIDGSRFSSLVGFQKLADLLRLAAFAGSFLASILGMAVQVSADTHFVTLLAALKPSHYWRL